MRANFCEITDATPVLPVSGADFTEGGSRIFIRSPAGAAGLLDQIGAGGKQSARYYRIFHIPEGQGLSFYRQQKGSCTNRQESAAAKQTNRATGKPPGLCQYNTHSGQKVRLYMQIKLNIDTEQLRSKPAIFDGRLRNRLCNAASIKEIKPEELADYVRQGRTFTPAVMTGTTGETWQSQQVICADIDNDTGKKDQDGHKIRLENPLMPEQALDVMRQNGINPYFMYYSFSNREEWPKYRIVLVLDRPITDPAEANDLIARFTGIFNTFAPHCADTSASDNARLYYGGRPDSVFYNSGSITKIEQLHALPVYKEPETNEPAQDFFTPVKRPAARGQSSSFLQAQFEHDKEHFDLSGYVQATAGSRPHKIGSKLFFNPCPICGHNDDFQITGGIWHCWSSSSPDDAGGTIIDYLMFKEGLTLSAAIDKFKFDIMGYDREEWRQAHLEAVRSGFDGADDETPTEQPKGAGEGAQQAAGDDLETFLETITTEAYKPYKTGLSFFDDLLGGGVIRQSLLLLMAAPGTGKTTLAQQIAESMAANGKPVVYLNLEMSREQMLAKAISSRLARKNGVKATALDVLQGYRWTPEQQQAIPAELEAYRKEVYPYLRYNPAGISSDLKKISEYLRAVGEKAAAEGKEAPAIILDYLHLVTGGNLDIQELIKQTVTMLKGYAIKYNTFAIGIVATNRDSNKDGRITMDSGRDSSNLEYTADYQLSLNYYALDQKKISTKDVEAIAELQQAKWRQMIIRVLKGRLVMPGRSARIYFNAAGNTFYGETDWMPADSMRVPFDEKLEDKAQDEIISLRKK